jgi:hypothetical protein
MFATYLLANYLYFQVFGSVNLFKLVSAGQFAKTYQNNQREHDVLCRCARRPNGQDHDPFSIRVRRKRAKTYGLGGGMRHEDALP